MANTITPAVGNDELENLEPGVMGFSRTDLTRLEIGTEPQLMWGVNGVTIWAQGMGDNGLVMYNDNAPPSYLALNGVTYPSSDPMLNGVDTNLFNADKIAVFF